MLFGSTDLAARIEHAAARMLTDSAEAIRLRGDRADLIIIPVGGGVATLTGDGSPLNKVAGLGFGAPVDQADFDSHFTAIEQGWARHGAPVQVELSCLADPSIGTALTRRAYELRGFENVLGCPLPRPASQRPPAGAIEVAVNPPGNLREWIDTIVTGFATPDTQGVASQESYPRDVIEQAIGDMNAADGFTHFIARRNGAVAGGASMRISDGVAQLCGAATLPEHRRRGVQSALLESRLDAAADAGCDLAVVTTLPGSKSQENVHRRGFSLLYTRAILVRETTRSPGALP